MDTGDLLPVIQLEPYLDAASKDSANVQELCQQLASCLHKTGCAIVLDPRVQESHNEEFLDVMERYFNQDDELKMLDTRPEYHFQVGATPSGTEVPRCVVDPSCLSLIQQQPAEHRAVLPTGPDAKWRFFWRLGTRPPTTRFPQLNADPVVPKDFQGWSGVMDGWGGRMLEAVKTVAEMTARGLALAPDAFTSLMEHGPHLLAPTGSNLNQHNGLETIFAGFHSDLNFLTIHGKSRFPGLFVWLRDGRKLEVRIPAGCLLVQAGKQMEHLTGGEIMAGFHEVVCTSKTRAAMEVAKAAGRPLWRVSSTVFSHIASDQVLQPLGRFATAEAAQKYPAMCAGHQVQKELEIINLKDTRQYEDTRPNTSCSNVQPAAAVVCS